MRLTIDQLKKLLPQLSWSADRLAEKLSLIGHETEVVNGSALEIKLTSNRKDCQDISYLAFDLAGIYPELGDNSRLINSQPGKRIPVTLERVNKILGAKIAQKQYRQLTRLGFLVEENLVVAPEFRQDVSEDADIAEEVFRLVGPSYLKIETLPKLPPVNSPIFEEQNQIKRALVEAGATETRTISFSHSGQIGVKNPFSRTQPYLRENLTDGLLETLARNPFSRRNIFFEIGQVFRPDEETHLGIAVSGFKDIDKISAQLSRAVGHRLDFRPAPQERLQRLSVRQPNVLTCEFKAVALKGAPSEHRWPARLPSYRVVGSFPPLVRDVSLTLAGSEEQFSIAVRQEFPELLLIEKIDSFTNPTTGQTSETFRLIFQKLSGSYDKKEIEAIDRRLAAFI